MLEQLIVSNKDVTLDGGIASKMVCEVAVGLVCMQFRLNMGLINLHSHA